MDESTYFGLSEDERKKRAQLTPKEKSAVDAFLAAARALPKSICIDVDDNDYCLSVQKRITRGAATQVAKLKKRSLCF